MNPHADARIQKMAECYLESWLQQIAVGFGSPRQTHPMTETHIAPRPVSDSQSEMAEIVSCRTMPTRWATCWADV